MRLPDSERESLLQRLSETERRMRAITEQLYLYGQYHSEPLIVPTARDIQRQLDADTLLIEFYTDGSSVWAFTLDQDEITLHPAQQLDQSLAKLEANLRRALQVDPQSPAAAHLTQLAKMLLQRLYNMLITPLLKRIEGRKRLVIVPYGMLHYLPFNMLYDGQRYLIEQVELVVLPSASLLIRKSQQRGSETLVFAHSSDGLLTHTAQEAEIVSRLFGGTLYREADATRNMLQAPPGQILHIAAHGEHRIDQPDLSYIQLADGQLYADDLLQLDLSYELVTLSCCETGRTRVAPGDELIGLGRGFLYGGAGALVASLWPVSDARTLTLMEHFYHALAGGARKDSALREAQSVILQTESGLHPAYWGAFQLIGDPAPLSSRSQSA